jgi:hypothetical protein
MQCSIAPSAACLKFLHHWLRVRQELQTESGTRIIDLLVPFAFRSSCERVLRCITNFGKRALAHSDLIQTNSIQNKLRRSRGPDWSEFYSFIPRDRDKRDAFARRGRRESRMPITHPQPRARKQKSTRAKVTAGSIRINPAFPARMVLTVSFALSPVIGLSCHRRWPRCAKHRRQLDASVEASRPHDFAVRERQRSSAVPSRPSHPAPNVRDDREAPLLRGVGRREGEVCLVRSASVAACDTMARRANQLVRRKCCQAQHFSYRGRR